MAPPPPTPSPAQAKKPPSSSSKATRSRGRQAEQQVGMSPKGITRSHKRGGRNEDSDNATGSSSACPSPASSSSSCKRAKTGGGGMPPTTVASEVVAKSPLVCSPKEKAGDDQCKGCNKKKFKACEHEMCIICCEKLGKKCKGHEKALKIRKEEEELLAHPCGAKLDLEARRVYKGDYQEDNFEYVGDTVTVFCLVDFLRNKKWSKETLEQCERSRRAAMARKPRDAASSSQPVDKRCRKERWQAKREALLTTSTA